MAFLDKLISTLNRGNRSRSVRRARRSAFQVLDKSLKPRIHERGQASDNTQLGTMSRAKDPDGKYSKSYGKRRRRKSLTTAVKNLDFYGNFKRGYGVGTLEDGTPTYGFFTTAARIIGEGQESQTGKVIFRPTPEERIEMMTTFKDVLFRGFF